MFTISRCIEQTHLNQNNIQLIYWSKLPSSYFKFIVLKSACVVWYWNVFLRKPIVLFIERVGHINTLTFHSSFHFWKKRRMGRFQGTLHIQAVHVWMYINLVYLQLFIMVWGYIIYCFGTGIEEATHCWHHASDMLVSYSFSKTYVPPAYTYSCELWLLWHCSITDTCHNSWLKISTCNNQHR